MINFKQIILASSKPKFKEGLDYGGREKKPSVAKEWHDRNGNLIYYSYEFYQLSCNKFIEEYSYNHISKRVDYRNNEGLRWQKTYNKDGFEMIISKGTKKDYYALSFSTLKLHHMNQKQEVDERIYDLKDDFIIDGVDCEDRFVSLNDDLALYLSSNISSDDLIKRVNILGVDFLHKATILLSDEGE